MLPEVLCAVRTALAQGGRHLQLPHSRRQHLPHSQGRLLHQNAVVQHRRLARAGAPWPRQGDHNILEQRRQCGRAHCDREDRGS